VPLPESIPVQYAEEEAEFVSMRPVVRQTFRGTELVDRILAVTGKNLPRIQQVPRSGTVVFHSYRYCWQGFEAASEDLEETLVHYPDSDPSRPFHPNDCVEVILESRGSSARHLLRLRREEARKKRILRSRSFWDCLMETAGGRAPSYREYSYAFRSDVYLLPLDAEQTVRLAQGASEYAPRVLRAQLGILTTISQVVFVCPRALER
jgi:hypothetical protein